MRLARTLFQAKMQYYGKPAFFGKMLPLAVWLTTLAVLPATGQTYFQGTADFDPGAGVANLTSAGSSDIFIAKYDASGNHLWARNMGGMDYAFGRSLAVGN